MCQLQCEEQSEQQSPTLCLVLEAPYLHTYSAHAPQDDTSTNGDCLNQLNLIRTCADHLTTNHSVSHHCVVYNIRLYMCIDYNYYELTCDQY